jgi:hypothetical protein
VARLSFFFFGSRTWDGPISGEEGGWEMNLCRDAWLEGEQDERVGGFGLFDMYAVDEERVFRPLVSGSLEDLCLALLREGMETSVGNALLDGDVATTV